MGLSPWYTGQTDPTWQLTFVSQSDAGAQTALDLTGYPVVLKMAPAAPVPVFVTGTGTLTVPNPATGVVNYVVGTSDAPYTTVGVYLLQLKATKGASVKQSDYYELQVRTGG